MKYLYFIFLIFLSNVFTFSSEVIKINNTEYIVDLDTLKIKVNKGTKDFFISNKQPFSKSTLISKDKSSITISRDSNLINLVFFEDYMYIKATLHNGNFIFPFISDKAEEYILPLKNGKRVPTNDSIWKKYLEQKLDNASGSSVFSMNFFSIKNKDHYTTYIYDNRYHNNVSYKDDVFSFAHNYSRISSNNEISFKVYFDTNSWVDGAKLYRAELIKKNQFKTLKEKIKENRNVEKLLGAPHFYLVGESFFSSKDVIDFKKFKDIFLKNIDSLTIIDSSSISDEFKIFINDLKVTKQLSNYQKQTLIKYINDFLYDKTFKNCSSEIDFLKESKVIKTKLKETFGDSMLPIELWGEGNSLETLKTLKDFGIDKAWLGFHNYTMGEINPDFITKAESMGYLIAAYDSYKSIHPKGKEKWNTAQFQDESLFENATITKENGKKISGFNNFGRELNPAFSFDEVNYRLSRFSKLKFNSWFLDTDAVGEVFDDFTSGQESDEEEQINERLKRIELIKNKYNLVIGSEDGDDFAAPSISYGHGIFTGIVPWWIFKGMKTQNSEFFLGKYYSKDGGVPEYFEKEILLPFEADYLFYDERFNIPLYQLVYNDSVIGTNHWIFHNLKIKNRKKDLALRGILYNAPPMYHLDRKTLSENKDIIVSHFKNFSNLHRNLALEEMTNFYYLTEDNLVQKTIFSNKTEIIVNFSDHPYRYEDYIIESKSFKVLKKSE